MCIKILRKITRKVLQIDITKKPTEETETTTKRYIINRRQGGRKKRVKGRLYRKQMR